MKEYEMGEVAVLIENPVQFYSVEPLLDAMRNANLSYDIILPNWSDPVFQAEGWYSMELELMRVINEKRLHFLKAPIKKSYKISMSPYPVWWDVKSLFKVSYRYGYVFKAFNIAPENYLEYDAILCYGNSDQEFLSAYGKTCIVGEPKLLTYKKKESNHKKTILYLPTYGALSSIQETIPFLAKLPDQYEVIVKMHHGTEFLASETEKQGIIRSTRFKRYGCEKPLYELLSEADVVLSDNSGSIYDALAAGVPVARFAHNTPDDSNGFIPKYIELTHQGILPSTNDPENILQVIEKAMTPQIKASQRNVSEELFFDPVKGKNNFILLMKELIRASENPRYFALQCPKNSYYEREKAEKIKMYEKIENVSEKIENAKTLLLALNEEKSYRLFSAFDKFIKCLIFGNIKQKKYFLDLCRNCLKGEGLRSFVYDDGNNAILRIVKQL